MYHMIALSLIFVLFPTDHVHFVSSFTLSPRLPLLHQSEVHSSKPMHMNRSHEYRPTRCFMSSSSTDELDDSKPSQKRRRRRKDGKNSASMADDVTSPSDTGSTSEIPSKDTNDGNKDVTTTMATSIDSNNPVQMQVMDVRDVVAGKNVDSSNAGVASITSNDIQDSVDETDDDEDDDDDEYEYYYEDENNNEVIVGYSSSSSSSSLEQLLADAKKMREDTETKEVSSEEESLSVRSILSTIVTVDFFVVCGLLLWFLAGIFCSYIIKDDTVQIAFNGIFQPVVQPALGILMIGSALSSVFKGPEEDN